MPAVNEHRLWALNQQVEGVAFSLALITEKHYTYPQGFGSGFVDTSGNRFRADGHDYENGMIIRLGMMAGTPPAPLTTNVDYYVVGVLRDGTGDWFQVAATNGGAPIDITSGATGGYYFWSLHRLPVTVDAGTDVFSAARHPFVNGERVIFENVGGGLPGGVTANTNYYCRDVVAGVSFKIAATLGGTAIDITSGGSGTQLVYAPPLDATDSAAVWLNRETVTYSTSARQTWTGATATDPTEVTRNVSFTPGGFPIPYRYAYVFITEAGPVYIGKWFEDLGAGAFITLAGRSFAARDFTV